MLGLGNSLSGSNMPLGATVVPDSITGLDLWLKFNTGVAGASNTTTAANMVDNEVIHSWVDQAGNHNAAQNTDAHRPNWETATTDISFNGDNDHFDLASNVEIDTNQDFTIMIRHKFPNFDAPFALIGNSANDVIKVNNNTNITTKIEDGTANVWEETGGLVLATDVYYIFTLVRSGGSDGDLKMYIDGGAHSNKSWDDAESHQDADAFTLGNIGAAADTAINVEGFMRDVLVWKGTALSTSQRQGVYAYILAQ